MLKSFLNIIKTCIAPWQNRRKIRQNRASILYPTLLNTVGHGVMSSVAYKNRCIMTYEFIPLHIAVQFGIKGW